MPYSDDNTAAQMLANIASIGIPIDLTYRNGCSRKAMTGWRRAGRA